MRNRPAPEKGAASFNHWIAGIAPQGIGVIHHQLDDQGHQLSEQVNAISHLIPVNRAIPGGTTVNQLIAKRVQAIEYHPEKCRRITTGQGTMRGSFATGKPVLPGTLINLPAVIIPKALKHIRIIQQHSNTAGELLPNQITDTAILVQITNLLQKSLERPLLR